MHGEPQAPLAAFQPLRYAHAMTEPLVLAPTATRRDLQLGRRAFHLVNGVSVATAYAIFFTHTQIVHVFGTIACLVYVLDRVRIAYPEVVARHAPAVNRLLVRAEEQVRESAMTPYAIAVLLTILTVPKPAALIAIYTLAIADPAAAVVGISWGRHKLSAERSSKARSPSSPPRSGSRSSCSAPRSTRRRSSSS